MTAQEPGLGYSEFPAVSRVEWKERVASDLGEGKTYDRIVWQTPDGFPLEPWYGINEPSPRIRVPMQAGGTTAVSCRRITAEDPEEANRDALRALEEGAGALEFVMTGKESCRPAYTRRLLSGISLENVPVWFSGTPDHLALTGALAAMDGFSANTGGLLSPPPAGDSGLLQALCSGEGLPVTFGTLCVDTVPFHDRGATPAEEVALALAGMSDMIEELLEAGIPGESIAGKMTITMAVGSSHFLEMAKPRALRALLPHLLEAYGIPADTLPRLFARTSRRNLSLLDPHTNLLRLTTETASAIAGGYETLEIAPFDAGKSTSAGEAARISMNIHLLLTMEAGLGRVQDPAAGSPFIETMTAKLAGTAWEIFKTIESAGGLSAASPLVESMIAAARSAALKQAATRKKTLVGVNRYPADLLPQQLLHLDALTATADESVEGSETARFERIRLRTASHALKTGRTPSVFIWMHGNPAVSRLQAGFTEDFFRCGGFAISGSAELAVEAASCATALADKPSFVVLCIAEKDPVPSAESICRMLKEASSGIIPVMAGKPPEGHERLTAAGIDSFIYTGVDCPAMLEKYQHTTGA
ncbi:methylmalonyl-CoA mutase subunit beta [Pelodictyon luteolum]|uniref:Heterodimeric methylmalonyl-CoA mutase small subunit n=1 Tax=Chlorobium luteolum (strain DSM 273 / BCRC 81028 / 2530) TaxID=319225 RepID=Q3B3D0_CHLL3|nr:methylmalonyl-CoA mutase subunit beta [Pelodictyon luteolum]ABB24151.1 heterodimeric methylmalonyl-CoA mutase small subunit [Pelodictyon luteolum DSM 273]